MADSPFSVYRLLRQHLLDAAKPAYLVTDKAFNLISANGELGFYNLLDLKSGESCEPKLSFLIGYDVSEPLELRFFQVNEDVTAHVVLLPHEGHLIILFMDASAAYQQELEIQQKTNDLLILSEKQDGLVKELVKARDSLANKHEELFEANSAKAKFIANMSEELKSPLTSILGHASLLKGDVGQSTNTLKMVEAIERGGRHLLTLVENLLDQMHIELDDLKLKLALVDINDLVQDLDSIFKPVAQRKKLKFIVETTSLPPGKLKLDEIRLRQVLVNLLNNAFKYTDMGTIRLTISWQDNRLLIEVYDTGRGIPITFQEEMFKPFKQGEEQKINDKQQAKGKGLGLSIVKKLIELMDGDIKCESILGAETSFNLSIPAEVVLPNQYIDTIADDIGFGESAGVLVIESNEDLGQLYDLALSKAGFVVSQCGSADEAVKFVTQKPPSLVLISLQSQDDCLNAVKHIRDAAYNDPILVLLSNESSTSSRSVFEAGGNGYITKPINIIDLIETIKAYVSPSQTDDSDVTMRTYLRERFNEYLGAKTKQLIEAINQLSSNNFDFETCNKLEKDVHQVLLTAEMYSYSAITASAKSVGNILKNRNQYSEAEFAAKLLEVLKVLYSEIQFTLDK